MIGKKINELPFLSNPDNTGMLPLEFSGTTYHIKFSSVTQNISDNISYVGEDIKCLKIKNNMSMTEVIESIGGVLCNPPSPTNPCLTLLIQEEDSGICRNPLKYLFDLSTYSWCVDNPPYECDGENPMEYFLNFCYNEWLRDNPPYECSGANPMEYFFNFCYNEWLRDNPPYECSGANPMEYFFDFCYTVWNNE